MIALQRGRTFTKNGSSIEPTMTVERMAQDGVEVAEYLIRHLHKKKIIILDKELPVTAFLLGYSIFVQLQVAMITRLYAIGLGRVELCR